MTQTELVEQKIHLLITERIELIEKISRSVREDLRTSDSQVSSLDERSAA